MDNAIKFSTSGSIIEIIVADEGGVAAVTVADKGPGIPPADRSRVLQRFVRLDESRSRSGSGLGLTLVAAAAKLHKAELTLQDNDPGLRISLTFPRSRRPSPLSAAPDPAGS